MGDLFKRYLNGLLGGPRPFESEPEQVVDGIPVTAGLKGMLELLLDDIPRLTGEVFRSHTRMTLAAVYRYIDAMEDQGWIEGEWDTHEPVPGHDRLRFYRLTKLGRTRANLILGKYDIGGA